MYSTCIHVFRLDYYDIKGWASYVKQPLASAEPSAYATLVSVGEQQHVCLFARHDIREGEELTFVKNIVDQKVGIKLSISTYFFVFNFSES